MRRAALIAFFVFTSGLHAEEKAAVSIPEWTVETGASVSGRAAKGAALDLFTSASVHRRWALGQKGWSVGAGLNAERYAFPAGQSQTPRRLESVALPLTLEFFQGDEAVAGVTISPGRYFADGAYRSSWDAPVEAATGFPLCGAWNGVVGVSHGRFYRNPLPILGVVWQAKPDVRVEAVFPEPAITWKFRSSSLRVGGELVGGGFRCAPATTGARSVEFHAYRLGGAFTEERGRTRITWSTGVESERAFEFDGPRPTRRARGAIYFGVSFEFRP